MFWLITARVLFAPIPPIPMVAMFTVSLGAWKPRPSTVRGTMTSPAPAAAAVVTKSRRDTPDGSSAGRCRSEFDLLMIHHSRRTAPSRAAKRLAGHILLQGSHRTLRFGRLQPSTFSLQPSAFLFVL
jgi:hypothetical protein